jgi:RNA polymerase sigma-70 factor (ECF subfamily)
MKLSRIFSPIMPDDEEVHPAAYQPVNFDIKEIVRKNIAKLPEKLRTPLILRDFDELTYQEIAEVLHTEVGTVKSRIFRARESLRRLLEPYQKELL